MKARELIESVVNGADPSQLMEIVTNKVKPGMRLDVKKRFIAGGYGTPSYARAAEWRKAAGQNDLKMFVFDILNNPYTIVNIDSHHGFVKLAIVRSGWAHDPAKKAREVYCGIEDLAWFRTALDDRNK